MKIDQNKLKKGTSEVPADCRTLIERLKSCSQDDLLGELKQIKSWSYGKCELFHWADVLDIFDEVLDKACRRETDTKWILMCDLEGNEQLKELLLQVLLFTALLIEHSFSRHLYNSMEHLTTLMSSSDMTVVLGVLNLLYVFSKRSNFITRLNMEKKQALVLRLSHLAESWGGKENGFGLADCCQDLPINKYPGSATTLHFEFYAEVSDDKSGRKNTANVVSCIHVDNLDKVEKSPGEIMEELLRTFGVPDDKQISLFTHIRLAHAFSKYERRIQCVQARLQAISILVYSNAIQDSVNSLLYNGLIEELVDILELKDPKLMDIKAASLRTLTSVIHLERNPKLNAIIDATGAASYHGFLPVLVRTCIQHMSDNNLESFPLPFATALFSFLYHLASYESGGEALESCGMMESLLKVINWYGEGQEHITFVTRAVRVVDLITNLDMAAFQSHGGLSAFINRLEHEVDICRKEQPFVIRPDRSESASGLDSNPASPASLTKSASPMDMDGENKPSDHNDAVNSGASTSVGLTKEQKAELYAEAKTGLTCFPQRAALLKSMLNFLKKAIPDPAFSESIRHLMDGSLPRSLKHIISNAEYYGASLFLLATDAVTVYVFQEPSLLSSLQDNGLTDVVLHALLIKDVPATREVLASLPNVFSALCLNARGLAAFVQCKPFERLFKVLLSPDYLPAMRRRRSSNPLGDTASNLGNAMDELMRHQPSLRSDATKAIIQLLEEVVSMGKDPKYICQKPQPKSDSSTTVTLRSPTPNEGTSSDEEEEEDDIPNAQSQTTPTKSVASDVETTQPSAERTPIPLMDYVLNVMKFVEAILSNNTTDDHCREFVTQKGLVPLMSILGLPNLPIDFPASASCQAVATVCKAVFTLSHEPQVLKQGLLQLNEVLMSLEPLHKPLDPPGGSVLLHELVSANNITEATLSVNTTPLLHALTGAHAYIMMFVHVCRAGQSDIRTISVSHWGSDLGLQVLKGLSQLYTSLVWESTVLLALCSENILPSGCEFGRADMEKLLPKDFKTEKDKDKGTPTSDSNHSLTRSTGEMGSNGVSAAMESLTTQESTVPSPMEMDDVTSLDNETKKNKLPPALQAQIRQIKPLLSASSRLGRALAELFGLLVKLCVGSHVRQRRTHQLPPQPIAPTPAARAVASSLTKLLANGLSWTPPPTSPVPKLQLTFYICSVGFTSPMLFDEMKYPYHLMLQKLVSSGGQDALFAAFNWALSCGGKVSLQDGLESPDLPDGTGEFLDAWLMLVEKMVNTKNVLESRHTLPTKSTPPGFVPFSPLQYLIKTHKAAFHAIMYLWDKKPLKVYGSRMSESILAILCHIIKGEATIKEKLAKEQEEKEAQSPSTSAGASSKPAVKEPEEPQVNQEQLQQLQDMGFEKEHCLEALLHSSSLEQATEYLLSHPPPVLGTPASLTPPIAPDMDLSEEDQMLRAIAMSLGENVLVSTDQTDSKKNDDEKKLDEESNVEESPLEKGTLDDFTNNVMAGCLKLLDSLPETVYRVCDLLVVITNRNGEKWRNEILANLVKEVSDYANKLVQVAAPLTTSDTCSILEWANKLSTVPEASKLAARLHLLSLTFEEMKMPCAEAVESSGLLELLVRALDAAQRCLSAAKDASTPKWLAPLMLLIDQFEKISITSRRKAEVEALLGPVHVWKWFDDRSGRWCTYSAGNNKTIDDAYCASETNIRFTAGRRRYTVHFNTMVQVNEETGNRRPIMLALPTKEEKEKQTAKEKEKKELTDGKEKLDDEKMDVEETASSSDKPEKKTDKKKSDSKPVKIVQGLTPDQYTSIVRSAVGLLGIPVEADTLHATLRVCLRLTRDHKYALIFAELGGPKLLLGLTQASAFQGFTSLATLLLRHVLEEPNVLRMTMEKVVRSPAQGNNSTVTGVSQRSLGAVEMHYVLRVLGPAACRNPDMFKEVVKDVFRIIIPPPPPLSKSEDESRYAGPNAAQILKIPPLGQQKQVPLEGATRDVIFELLNALAAKYNWLKEENASSNSNEVKPAQTLAEAIQEVVSEVTRDINDRTGMIRQGSALDLPSQDEEGNPLPGTTPLTISDATEVADSTKDGAKDAKTAEEAKKSRPLLPKAAVLRLLAELVRSYTSCALQIAQHTYPPGLTELVTEECSVLAFILDNLLPSTQTCGDKDCPALSRMLIASMAACNNCPDAQAALVNEVKSALQRALILPESSEKHAKIQALTNIISTMIDSCSNPGKVQNQVFKGQQATMNNMVKILVKRGLVVDLARIPHSLDLSSPSMANTVNCALKPLETLSRIVNQPQTVPNKNKPKNPADGSTAEGIVDEVAENNPITDADQNPSLENNDSACRDIQDIHIEDVTESRDRHEDLEESEPLDAVEPRQDTHVEELEEVLDELFNRNNPAEAVEQVLGEIIMTETTTSAASRGGHGDDDDEHVVIDDHHDSQMVSQEFSDDEVGEHLGGDRHDDHSSASDTEDDEHDGHDDDDDDDVNDDDEDDGADEEDDEDEEEEDEDDEGSDMEADNDDYQDFEESMVRMSDDNDLLVHLEDMFPPGQLIVDNTHIRTYQQLPISLHDGDTGTSDALIPSVPPAPSNVTANHPLLVRHPEGQSVSGTMAARIHRHGGFGRQRGTYRYNPSTQTLHVHYPAGGVRHPNPPAILQRLLGPDFLQLTNSLSSQAGTGHTRVLFGNDDLRIFASRPEEDLLDEFFPDPYGDSTGSGNVLSSVPSALTRWTEESRVLDGDSVHDCVTLLKPEILEVLEKYRDEELQKRREKRKNKDGDDKTKEDEKEENETNKTIEWTSPRSTSALHSSLIDAIAVSSAASSIVSQAALPTSLQLSTAASRENSNEVSMAERLATSLVDELLSAPVTSAPSINTTSSSQRQGTYLTHGLVRASLPEMLQTPSQLVQISTPAAPLRLSETLPTMHPSSFSSSPYETPISRVELPGYSSETPMETNSAAAVSSSSQLVAELCRQVPSLNAALARSGRTMEAAVSQSTIRPPSEASATPNSATVVASVESVITPEEPSNIISSEAVTVHSTPSGSSSEEPSISTPSSEMPVSSSDTASLMSSVLAAAAAAAAASSGNDQPGTSALTESGIPQSLLSDILLPDGVDPSFLAALPDNIRQEVVAEQLRLQRIQERAQQQNEAAAQQAHLGTTEVNPEFLAALPPAIQEEVLAQQRAEQARIASSSGTTTTEAPVDPANFISSLPTSLRQQVLADMDDSMIAVLPTQYAAEAQALRRELEDRHRRIMQERFIAQTGGSSLSSILRHAGLGRFRTGGIRATPRSVQPWTWAPRRPGQTGTTSGNVALRGLHLRGRHLLDHEALTCLLVLLFVDEPKLNTSRLHRVLRNLCYHSQTRNWVIRALLGIVQRTSECKIDSEETKSGKSSDKSKKKSSQSSHSGELPIYRPELNVGRQSAPSWLSIGLDAALGCRANVFQIQRSGKKSGGNVANSVVTIHPQASPVVCRHVLDTLISLAKGFPCHFAPGNNKAKEVKCDTEKEKEKDLDNKAKSAPSLSSPARAGGSAKSADGKENKDTEFWDLLIRLDSSTTSKKGKGVQRVHSNPNLEGDTDTMDYESSPIGQLMSMLAHPVIRRSQLLTDRLLRLLGLVSVGLPEMNNSSALANAISSSTPVTSLASTVAPVQPSVIRNAVVAPPVRSASDAAVPRPDAAESMETVEEKKSEGTDEEPILPQQLQLAVQVLTSKSCSEEGLEDATNLLLQLSKANNPTRATVLDLLLMGAQELGQTVCAHIRTLLQEIQEMCVKVLETDEDMNEADALAASSQPKGVIADRFGGGSMIVVNAPTKIKVGRELQLPSMVLLTNKTSSQQFFLRILKVIIQLREAARLAARKAKKAEAMANLEAEAEAIMEMVGRRDRLETQRQENREGEGALEITISGSISQQASVESRDTPMDVDQPSAISAEPSKPVEKKKEEKEIPLPRLSDLLKLDDLWETLGECLTELAKTPDHHAVLVLQSAVEAFFIVHAGEKDTRKPRDSAAQRREDQLAHLNVDIGMPMSPLPAASSSQDVIGLLTRENSVASVVSMTCSLPPDTQKFLKFAETHRTVLNQILRQSTTPLADGPFSVLVDHTRVLDFDVKRRYFRQELERMDEGMRREDVAVHVRREHVFEDSFRELHRRTPDEWKHRFYIVFEGEEGQDAGGLLREWYLIISREIFNPMYALFATSPGDRVTYTINPSSHCNSNHLSYFKFVGRIIAKAIYDNKLLECYFTRSFYKHILGVLVKYTDMESEDYAFYQGLVYLLENEVEHLGYDLMFSTEIQEFGVTETRELKSNGKNLLVNEDNKKEYVKLVCQMKMTGAIRKQLNAFLEGFYDIIPKRLISIFNEQELELLISGLPTVDIDDLKSNSEYHKYQPNSLQIQWFWRALRSFDQADRARFLQFVTGTSKVPLQGFAFLEGMNGIQKFQIHRDDRSTDRLPSAHTCFNQLDLPAYETYDKLRGMLLLAVNECSEGFGLA
ncbi:E3 ubiquitin-protein ligase HUWE1-like isoform X3 [Lineus longissimus]|uniref:E3 ubiquitin-protein ligase HUWE1-like isoform X3 n=1 Tax=Lineus longissimus TaxID=88925 RepID=UPI00315C87EF